MTTTTETAANGPLAPDLAAWVGFVIREKCGAALWPRSTDPALQIPQQIKRGDEAVDYGPAITAVVVFSYVIRPVQRKPMIRV